MMGGESDGARFERAREIMKRLVNSPPKPHDEMVPKRKGAPKPERRTAGKGRARVGEAKR